MAIKTSVIKYTKDDMMGFNVYQLRNIPNDERYTILRKFVLNEKNVNLSNVVKQPMIPTYLKNRYGDISSQTNIITRGTAHDQPEVSRRKLYVQKSETTADQINEEIRDLLSKLSDGNKEKLFDVFMKKEIPDECGQTLIDNIYLFAVDLSYLIRIYVEFIFLLKRKNLGLFNQLIEKIISTSCEPLMDDNADLKRLRMGNILLISEIFRKNNSIVTQPTIIKTASFLVQHVSPQNQDYLQLLCELLKNVVPIINKENHEQMDAIMKQLHIFAYDQHYKKQFRFMAQDIVELYNNADGETDEE